MSARHTPILQHYCTPRAAVCLSSSRTIIVLQHYYISDFPAIVAGNQLRGKYHRVHRGTELKPMLYSRVQSGPRSDCFFLIVLSCVLVIASFFFCVIVLQLYFCLLVFFSSSSFFFFFVIYHHQPQ